MNSPSPGFDLREKCAALSEAILSKHPSMPSLLQQIHKTIKQYPEQVTILTPEDVAAIINGLQMQTQTYLVTQTVGGKGKSSKSIAQKLLNLGDDAL